MSNLVPETFIADNIFDGEFGSVQPDMSPGLVEVAEYAVVLGRGEPVQRSRTIILGQDQTRQHLEDEKQRDAESKNEQKLSTSCGHPAGRSDCYAGGYFNITSFLTC